jgi:uridylate kinase
MDKLTRDLAAALRAVMTGEKAAIASASEVLKAYDADPANQRPAALQSLRIIQHQQASIADTLDRLVKTCNEAFTDAEIDKITVAVEHASQAETYLASIK